ncbi:MAG: hypothetical protein M0Z99_33955 [Betaproteobacteria bacterium]|nr:hypothetical protein [Betaproteobacteria bacterium]
MQKAASHDIDLKPTPAFDVDAARSGGPDIVVPPMGADLKGIVEDTKFMNEPVEIRCLETSDPNAPKAVELTVQTGGITGPMTKDENGNWKPGVAGPGGKRHRYVFQRGKKYTVPRFVFEALAHAKMTTLKQIPHPSDPMQMLQTNTHNFFYQFEMLRDSNSSPKAQAWREKVLQDPA